MSILDANGAIACAECGRQAQAVRDRLKAENAKLREENEHLIIKLNAEHIARQNVESENAKLRELIRHMHCCSNNEYTEYGIDFIAAHCKDCEYGNDFGHCNFERRMAELGIEVGE